jgi:starch synthase (maltosyl-transferring)
VGAEVLVGRDLDSVAVMTGRADLRLGITDVAPVVSCGSFSARAVVGEHVPITATVFREGHDAVAADVVLTAPDGSTRAFNRMERYSDQPDRWITTTVPDTEGRWTFRVEAWSDPLATWHHAVEVKIAAGQGPGELANDLEEGARLLDRVAKEAEGQVRDAVAAAATALRDTSLTLPARVAPSFSAAMQQYLHDHPVRELVTPTEEYEIWVDRRRALYGSWYEFFPRSEGPVVGGVATHGTFADATERLPAIAEMGFDVVYLPPIHPIGKVNRKGRNNTLTPDPDDVGSPWAIGSDEGGHDAVHPQLGTLDDFKAFVWRAGELGMGSRSTWRCRPHPTTRGSGSTRSGSPPSPTARSPTPRTRRRSTRTSTRSTSTTTRTASTPRCCGSCGTGCPAACASSVSTTRTPSR